MIRIKILAIEKLLFLLFFVLLMTNARLRIGDSSYYHFGGAELAISPIYIPLVCIFFIVILRVFKGSFFIKFDILDKLVFLYVLVLIPSVVFSFSITYSTLELVRELKLVVLYLWLRNFFYLDGAKSTFFFCVVVAILIQALLCLNQFVSGVSVGFLSSSETDLNKIAGGISRLVGSFGHPGILAQFLNITLISLLIRWLGAKNEKITGLYLCVFLIGMLVLLSTYSRTAMVVEAFLIIVVVLFSSKSIGLNISISRRSSLYFFLFSAVLLLIAFFGDQVVSRFEDAPSESSNVRLVLADISLAMIVDNPFVGVGLNNFSFVMSEYDTTGLSYTRRDPVHNIYLLVASEVGVLGLIVFLLKIGVFLKVGIKLLKSDVSILSKQILFSAVCGLLAIMLSGMVGWSWRLDSIHSLYWIILSIIGAVYSENVFLKNKKYIY
jgi:O-antigen ligase